MHDVNDWIHWVSPIVITVVGGLIKLALGRLRRSIALEKEERKELEKYRLDAAVERAITEREAKLRVEYESDRDHIESSKNQPT